MARRGDTHRLLRWLWTSRRLDARLARLTLLPAAGLWRTATRARDAVRARGWVRTDALPLPAIRVGNLTVGDSGRTPVLIWIARHYAAQGLRPGILVQGAAPWRAAALQHAVPDAAIAASVRPDAAAGRLLADGADVALLEGSGGFGGPEPHLSVVVVGAETARAVRWPLPAGPWREGWSALAHADLVVVTRRRAPLDVARALAEEIRGHTDAVVAIAHLGVRHFEGLVSGDERPASALAGRRVVAASGSSDPDAFVGQVKATGAAVQVHTWQADGELRDEDVAWLAHATRRADYVVVSEPDAVKLRDRWPARIAEPLVAVLDLTWEANGDLVAAGLDALLAPPGRG
jgi:tetraacyldisaccharide 4'-kinase